MAMQQTKQISVTDKSGTNAIISYRGIPDTWPICHKSVYPKTVTGIICGNYPNIEELQIVFQCVSNDCEKAFIGIYRDYINSPEHYFKLSYVLPKRAKKEVFSDQIKNISPMFVEIYNQSITAEAMNLSQIIGMGMRKALEFLVKDFAIHKNPNKADEIKSTWLTKCIKDYIDDNNVKRCAELASWLANDESHYLRKWENKDINDLKTLIRLTVNWIDNVLLTKQYLNDMKSN